MIREMALANDQVQTNDVRLWRAVIASSIQDWLSGPLRLKREAERYLFDDSVDLRMVCELAGINIGRLRARLNNLRGQAGLVLLPVAA
jgi:hypothetical protein